MYIRYSKFIRWVSLFCLFVDGCSMLRYSQVSIYTKPACLGLLTSSSWAHTTCNTTNILLTCSWWKLFFSDWDKYTFMICRPCQWGSCTLASHYLHVTESPWVLLDHLCNPQICPFLTLLLLLALLLVRTTGLEPRWSKLLLKLQLNFCTCACIPKDKPHSKQTYYTMGTLRILVVLITTQFQQNTPNGRFFYRHHGHIYRPHSQHAIILQKHKLVRVES